MASPQKENGYTPIANELVEALSRTRINGEAMQVLWVILRKTYGYHKKEDPISLSQFVEMTKLPKPTVCKALRKLKSINIITQKANDVANKYCFIKDYSLWKPLPKKPTLPKKPIVVGQKANNHYPKSHIQKIKDNTTKDISKPDGLQGSQFTELIDSFKEVNPSYTEFYKNKTERGALEFMAKTWGYDKLLRTIQELPNIINQPYAPKVTKPTELKRDIGKLIAFTKQKTETLNKKHNNFIL